MRNSTMASEVTRRASIGQPAEGVSRRLRCPGQRGSAMVEAGLLLPLLILLTCGSMDLARVFFAGIAVEGAARSGVQLGSFSIGEASLSKMNAAADADATGQGLTGLTTSSRTFCSCVSGTGEISCATGTCSGAIPSVYVETTANYTFHPIIPYPGIPRNIAISNSARFRVQ
jgi:Flp pilus assembly protein TadG